MGLWKEYFHWSILLRWDVLGWIVAILPAIAGLLLFFDQYSGANVCFAITSIFLFAKISHAAIISNDSLAQRVVFTFVLFGIVGVGIVETVRGVNNWAASKRPPIEKPDVNALKLKIDRLIPLYGFRQILAPLGQPIPIPPPHEPIAKEDVDTHVAVVGTIVNNRDVQATAGYWEMYARLSDGRSIPMELIVPTLDLTIGSPGKTEFIHKENYWPYKLDMRSIPAKGISYGFMLGVLRGVTPKDFDKPHTSVTLCFKDSSEQRICDTVRQEDRPPVLSPPAAER